MEIISYVGASSAVKKTSVHIPVSFPRGTRSVRASRMNRLDAPRAVARTAKVEKEFAAVGISQFLSMLLLLFVLVIIPFTVFNALSFFENHTFALHFEENAGTELDVLDAAMSRFAMETVTEGVDENGNVLASDGSVLSVASIGIGEAVTYQTYTVRSGDSISTISRKFGLSNISTLIAVNNIENVRSLRSGQKLKIPSTDGLVYKVASGDSLNSLSVKYHVSVEEILDANDLASETLSVGMELFIPGAKMDATQLKKAMGELFVYPITASWRLTSRFGRRADPFTGVASNHTGIDMACPTGTPIRAAMSGTVVYSGWSNIFGNYVIINHGNGYQTLYGHMSKILAKKGQHVEQTTKIGLVGSTGYSTGPHLHFTVYKNGKLVDPLTLLKK